MSDQGTAARTVPIDRGICHTCGQRIRVMAFLDDPHCSDDCAKTAAARDLEDTPTP